MHVYVQKSTRTIFPRRSSTVSGFELSQPVAPSKPGKWPSTGNSAVPACRCLPKRLMSVECGHGEPLGPRALDPEGIRLAGGADDRGVAGETLALVAGDRERSLVGALDPLSAR